MICLFRNSKKILRRNLLRNVIDLLNQVKIIENAIQIPWIKRIVFAKIQILISFSLGLLKTRALVYQKKVLRKVKLNAAASKNQESKGILKSIKFKIYKTEFLKQLQVQFFAQAVLFVAMIIVLALKIIDVRITLLNI